MDLSTLILLLADLTGFGERTLDRILARLALGTVSPEQFLRAEISQLVHELGLTQAQATLVQAVTPEDVAKAEDAAGRLRRSSVHLVTRMDAAYPHKLVDRMPEPPAVLTVYGNMRLLSSPLFCTANSNNAPEAALAACDIAAEELVVRGMAPVTGHNRPAYQRAALVARRLGAPVAYVLDRGLLSAFSGDLTRDLFAAARIWSPAFDPQSDVALTAFLLMGSGVAHRNRTRDAMIFGLADTVVQGWVRPAGQMARHIATIPEFGQDVISVWSELHAEP